MTEEEVKNTTQMHTMMMEKDSDEEISIIEEIEEFEDKIIYLDISKEKKEKLKKICDQIKQEEQEETREFLFHLLQQEIEE